MFANILPENYERSMKKKDILVVIKDNMEFKLIVSEEIVGKLVGKYNVSIMSPVTADEKFRKDVLSRYAVDFVDVWPVEDIKFIDKVIYWCKRQAFFVYNATQNESCFQKAWVYFGIPEHIVLRGKYRKILKALTFFLSILARPLGAYIFCHRKYFSRSYTEKKFDYIFFGRPDSMINALIYNTFKKSDSKIITLCRNWDTPALKGIFTIPSDITITFEKELSKLLNRVNRKENFGKIICCQFPYILKNRHKRKENKIHILYATSLPRLYPDEPVLVKYLIEELRDFLADSLIFRLRLHPEDTLNRYKFIEEYPNVQWEKSEEIKVFYKSHYKKKLAFNTLQTVENLHASLNGADLLISVASTINYEAVKFGVPSCYLNFYDYYPFNYVYEREHLKILSQCFDIPISTNINELKTFIKNACGISEEISFGSAGKCVGKRVVETINDTVKDLRG